MQGILRQLAPPLDPESAWVEVRPRIESEPAFAALGEEEDRARVFADYIAMLQDACSHHHSQPKRKKKKSKVASFPSLLQP